jgi:fucose permease
MASGRQRTGLLVGLAYAAFVSLGLPDGLTGVAWPSIRTSFGLSLDALGALMTTITIGYLLSSFSSGRVLARLGVGWLLVLSCLATAFGLLGYSVASFWLIMVGLGLLVGLGGGAIDAGLNTYAAEHFSARQLNWLHAAFGFGSALGPLIMSSVISLGQPWRLGYLLVGCAQLLLALGFALTRAHWQTQRPQHQAAALPSAPMLATLRLPQAWLSMALFFLYAGLELSAGQWLYSLLTEGRGMTPGSAGVWLSIYWGSLTVGRLVSGVIVERMPLSRLLQICLFGALLGAGMLWFAGTAPLALVGVALLGLTLAPMFPSFIALTPARMGPQHTANTVGFQIAAAMLGGTALASSFGVLADRFGLELLGPFLVGIAVLLGGMFVVLDRLAAGQKNEPESS